MTDEALLCGVAQVSRSAEALELMVEAVRGAAADAGAPGLAQQLDAVIVPIGTWPYADPGRALAREVGSDHARSIVAELGVSQQGAINEGLRLIMSGEAQVVAVVGGESRRFAREGSYSDAPGAPDVVLERPDDFVHPAEISAGSVFPAVRSYAMIERAFGLEWNLSDAEILSEISTLWAKMSQVGAQNPFAAFPTPRSAEDLATISSSNPMLAAPYLRWHASQWTVDQAAALLLCSEAAARRLGVEAERVLRPQVALESTHVVPLVQREELGRWPAMQVLGRAMHIHLGRPPSEADVTEIYSCFPAAVRVQAAELGISLEHAPTITGGMTFAGGPFNSFVLHATCAVAERLRDQPGALGLVTTVSGLLTKPGLAAWSTSPVPDGRGALVGDLAAEAAMLSPALEVDPDPRGPLLVETATAFEEDGALSSILIGRTDQGRRAVVRSDDASLALDVIEHAPVGEHIQV